VFDRTPAVCLHVTDFSETSQILRFFTPTAGKVGCIAKGAKRKKSAFLAPFDLLSVYDLIRIEKRPGTLDILTKAERVRAFTRLREDYPRFVAGCYAADFVDQFAPEGQPIEGLYELLIASLERLEQGTAVPDAVFSFESLGLRALGYLPRLRDCGACRRLAPSGDLYFSVQDGGVLCPGCRPREQRWFPVRRAAVESIARFGEGDMPKEPIKKSLVLEIRQVLDSCIRHHLDRELRSGPFLRGVIALGAP
jgi:DNA repair protein RecO (recombination protein O)